MAGGGAVVPDKPKRYLAQRLAGLAAIVIASLGATSAIYSLFDPDGFIMVEGVRETSLLIRALVALTWIFGIAMGIVILKYDREAARKQFLGWVRQLFGPPRRP